MHEMSIAQSILEIVEDSLKKNDAVKLNKVIVEIGELVAVVPDSLQFCYGAITANTPLKDSELVIEIVPVMAQCENCGKEFKVDSFLFYCPHCESTDVTVRSGQELRVTELDVD